MLQNFPGISVSVFIMFPSSCAGGAPRVDPSTSPVHWEFISWCFPLLITGVPSWSLKGALCACKADTATGKGRMAAHGPRPIQLNAYPLLNKNLSIFVSLQLQIGKLPSPPSALPHQGKLQPGRRDFPSACESWGCSAWNRERETFQHLPEPAGGCKRWEPTFSRACCDSPRGNDLKVKESLLH